jgi:hypothetical protein
MSSAVGLLAGDAPSPAKGGIIPVRVYHSPDGRQGDATLKASVVLSPL